MCILKKKFNRLKIKKKTDATDRVILSLGKKNITKKHKLFCLN